MYVTVEYYRCTNKVHFHHHHWTCFVLPKCGVSHDRILSGPSSWLSGVGQDRRGLREAAVYSGAVPQSRLAPRVHSQTLRSHQPPQISPVLQVTSAGFKSITSVLLFGVEKDVKAKVCGSLTGKLSLWPKPDCSLRTPCSRISI